jgi:hypothetical protein
MGDSELPPTYYFSGITFNSDFYQSSSSDYLTATTGKKIFLTFPYAQGSESIAQLYSSNIDSLTPTSTFNFLDTQTAGINIGDSVTGTITIGSASSVTNINGVGTIYANKFDTLSATTNTTFLNSITSGNIDIGKFQVGGVFELANGSRTASISIGNNATAGTLTLGAAANANTRILGGTISIGYGQGTNTIDIGNEQTTGDINIGVSAGRLAGGSINICSTNSTGLVAVPIKIGNSTSTTAMNGTCTFANQITASLGITSAGNITTSGTATITALSTGSLIGPYKNAATANASITTAGVITGTSLVLGTGAITTVGNITSTGAISGTTITGSGLIKGSSFQNTNGSSTIDSTGLIGGSALQIALNGSISVGGLAAITNGIHVVGEIRSTTGNFLATAGTITAGNGLIGAYQNTTSTPSASITTAGVITGSSLALGSGAIGCGTITSTGHISTTGTNTMKSAYYDAITDTTEGTTALRIGNNVIAGTIEIGNAMTTGDIKIGLSDIVGATITVGTASTATTINGTLTASNGLTLASGKYITTSHSGTIAVPTLSQVGYIQSVAYPSPTLPNSTQIRTMASITLDPGTWILTGAVSIGSTQNLTHGYISFGDISRTTSIAPVDANDSAYGNTSFVGATVSNRVTPNLTVYVSPTGSTTYYFNLSATYTAGPGFNSNYWKLYAIRIA